MRITDKPICFYTKNGFYFEANKVCFEFCFGAGERGLGWTIYLQLDAASASVASGKAVELPKSP